MFTDVNTIHPVKAAISIKNVPFGNKHTAENNLNQQNQFNYIVFS